MRCRVLACSSRPRVPGGGVAQPPSQNKAASKQEAEKKRIVWFGMERMLAVSRNAVESARHGQFGSCLTGRGLVIRAVFAAHVERMFYSNAIFSL